jgi:hypothetical protein
MTQPKPPRSPIPGDDVTLVDMPFRPVPEVWRAVDGTTSAAPADPDRWSVEGYEKAIAAVRAMPPPPPPVTFHEVDGGFLAMVGGEPAGWMTREQFEELKRQIKETP